MARFAKDAMLDELQTILLYEADHILIGRGEVVAAAFIGFELDDEGEHLNLRPSKVDLDLFPIADTFRQGYDYGFNPSPLNICGLDVVQDLQVFMEATPRAGGILSGGTTHAFMSPEGMCRQVADAAMARWKLADHRGDLTVREIALLADMSEGAVRNAISLGEAGGLQAVKGSKPLVVSGDVAERWLKSRRGFVPTPATAKDDAFLGDRIAGAVTVAEIVGLIRHLASLPSSPGAAFLDQVGAASWNEVTSEIAGMHMGSVQRYAEALGVDVPMFVGKATEVALRERLALMPS